ncbi:MAG: NAD(P)-dependent oxidoreductase [Nocardioides sp.]
MTNVGFIGLGIMGGPMALNLARAGHAVRAHNRSRPRMAEVLVSAGVELVDGAAEAVQGAEVVVTMLPDSPDVVAVLRGAVFDAAEPGTVVVDCSTIRPDVSRELAAEADRRGLGLVDAPVSGGEQGAIDATLSIMVGGSAGHVQRVREVLDAMGSTVVHVGESGSGQTVKAANQLIVAGNIALLAEALVFLDAQQVDLDRALTVLQGGLAGSTVMARKSPGMVAHTFTPGFRAELHHKDLGIFTAAAREVGVVTPVGSLVANLVASLVAQGRGGLDHSALLLAVEQLSGRTREDT